MRKPLEWSLVVALVTLAFSACGPSGPYVKPVYPVKGVLLVDGKPMAGVQVIAYPVERDEVHPTLPMGTTNEQGEFQMMTYNPGDGMPEGEYKLGFTRRSENGAGNDAFGGKFAKPNEANPKTVKVAGGPVDMGKLELATK